MSEFQIDDINLMMKVAFSGTQNLFDKVNAILLDIQSCLDRGSAVPEIYAASLNETAKRGKMAFNSIDSEISYGPFPAGNSFMGVVYPIEILSVIVGHVPDIAFEGKIFSVENVFGKKVYYELHHYPELGEKEAMVESHYLVEPSTVDMDTPYLANSPLKHSGPQSEQRVSYEDWWKPVLKNSEPTYSGYNQKMDANAACWLLYEDCLFFNEGDIAWDGAHHSIVSIQYNLACPHAMEAFLSQKAEHMMGFVSFLLEIEKDEGLKVPRSMIHPITQKALPEGDLTGITLLNLQACAKALIIVPDKPHHYMIMVDSRVFNGIPDFTNLMGRLIWDMREYNAVEAPFGISIALSRNFDANAIFGDEGFLDEPVAHVSTEAFKQFDSRPEVVLSDTATSKKENDQEEKRKAEAAKAIARDLTTGTQMPVRTVSLKSVGFEGQIDRVKADLKNSEKLCKERDRLEDDLERAKESLRIKEAELSELGFFNRGRKKELSSQIADLQSQIPALKSSIQTKTDALNKIGLPDDIIERKAALEAQKREAEEHERELRDGEGGSSDRVAVKRNSDFKWLYGKRGEKVGFIYEKYGAVSECYFTEDSEQRVARRGYTEEDFKNLEILKTVVEAHPDLLDDLLADPVSKPVINKNLKEFQMLKWKRELASADGEAGKSNELLAKLAYEAMPVGEPITNKWIVDHVAGIVSPNNSAVIMSILVKEGLVERMKLGKVMTYTRLE